MFKENATICGIHLPIEVWHRIALAILSISAADMLSFRDVCKTSLEVVQRIHTDRHNFVKAQFGLRRFSISPELIQKTLLVHVLPPYGHSLILITDAGPCINQNHDEMITDDNECMELVWAKRERVVKTPLAVPGFPETTSVSNVKFSPCGNYIAMLVTINSGTLRRDMDDPLIRLTGWGHETNGENAFFDTNFQPSDECALVIAELQEDHAGLPNDIQLHVFGHAFIPEYGFDLCWSRPICDNGIPELNFVGVLHCDRGAAMYMAKWAAFTTSTEPIFQFTGRVPGIADEIIQDKRDAMRVKEATRTTSRVELSHDFRAIFFDTCSKFGVVTIDQTNNIPPVANPYMRFQHKHRDRRNFPFGDLTKTPSPVKPLWLPAFSRAGSNFDQKNTGGSNSRKVEEEKLAFSGPWFPWRKWTALMIDANTPVRDAILTREIFDHEHSNLLQIKSPENTQDVRNIVANNQRSAEARNVKSRKEMPREEFQRQDANVTMPVQELLHLQQPCSPRASNMEFEEMLFSHSSIREERLSWSSSDHRTDDLEIPLVCRNLHRELQTEDISHDAVHVMDDSGHDQRDQSATNDVSISASACGVFGTVRGNPINNLSSRNSPQSSGLTPHMPAIASKLTGAETSPLKRSPPRVLTPPIPSEWNRAKRIVFSKTEFQSSSPRISCMSPDGNKLCSVFTVKLSRHHLQFPAHLKCVEMRCTKTGKLLYRKCMKCPTEYPDAEYADRIRCDKSNEIVTNTVGFSADSSLVWIRDALISQHLCLFSRKLPTVFRSCDGALVRNYSLNSLQYVHLQMSTSGLVLYGTRFINNFVYVDALDVLSGNVIAKEKLAGPMTRPACFNSHAVYLIDSWDVRAASRGDVDTLWEVTRGGVGCRWGASWNDQ